MKYVVKTAFSISTLHIKSSTTSTIFGTGQGSGASPAVWLLISTVLLSSLKALSPGGMHFKSPTTHLTIERFSDAFVDDTPNGLNDSKGKKLWTLGELLLGLTAMAKTWERLLFSSGGALELKKCSYYVTYWTWQDGLPGMLSQRDRPGSPS